MAWERENLLLGAVVRVVFDIASAPRSTATAPHPNPAANVRASLSWASLACTSAFASRRIRTT